MLLDELTSYLASYEDWHAPTPAGWQTMQNMPLLARAAEFLFGDGHTEQWPISNAQFLISSKRPVAWRNAITTEGWARKQIIDWVQSADYRALHAVRLAIQRHEQKLKDAA